MTGEATLLEDTNWLFYAVQCLVASVDKQFIRQSHDSHRYVLVYQPTENDVGNGVGAKKVLFFSVLCNVNTVSIIEDHLPTFKVGITLRKSGDLSGRRQDIQWGGKYLVGVRGRKRMARLVGDRRKATGTPTTTNDTQGMKNNTSEHSTSSALKSYSVHCLDNKRPCSLNSCCNCFQRQSAFLKCQVIRLFIVKLLFFYIWLRLRW